LSDAENNPPSPQPLPEDNVASESAFGDRGSASLPSILREDASFSAPPPQGVLPGAAFPAHSVQPIPPQLRYASLPPALRVPWNWVTIIGFVVGTILVGVGLSVIAGILFAALGHDPSKINPASPSVGFALVVIQGLLDVALLLVLLGLVKWHYHLKAWSGLGWHPLPAGKLSRGSLTLGLVFLGILLSFVVAAASQLIPSKTQLPIEQLMQSHRTAAAFMLMAVVLAPVVEETLFRGFLYPVAARSFGVPIGILITGTLFGLLHGSQLGFNLGLIGLMIFVGSILTWIRYKTDTVLASFIVHTAYNGIQVVGYLIATHGLTKSIPHT
jgi:membrane protease YdiL (CAAX protease family)